MHIESGLDNFKEKVLGIVNETSAEYNLQYNGIFINKITSETNRDDSYHRDECDLTIVTYLNSDYEGGDFEYIIDNKIFTFKPTVNSSIMMDKKILHRVLPVINGTRYSLVTWFRLINKNII
jgi:predicted 2-oxoglutarate/Fe(II)-dependent dioxygenase YbiX